MLKFPAPFAFFLVFSLFFATVYAQYTWKSVQFTGGGYVPGITFHPTTGDGYIRTDVGGAYSLNTDGSWAPINDSFADGNDMGSIAIAIDESDANALYTTGGLYTDLSWCGTASFFRSSNKGQTWEKIPLASSNVSGATSVKGNGGLCLGGNGEGRGTGNRIAAKGNTIYFATNQNGLLKSTDKGSTWTVLTVASLAEEGGFTAVFIDKNNAVYAAPYAGGLYKSTDAGSNWSQVSEITGTVYQMVYNSTADIAFITTNTNKTLDQGEASGGKLWKLNGTSVEEITNFPQTISKPMGLVGLAVNPADANEIAVATANFWKGSGDNWNDMVPHEYLFYTTDGGNTWKDILGAGTFDASTAGYVNSSNPHWISAVGIDPKKSGRIIFGTGFGILSTENAKADNPVWKFTSKGIEETVPLGFASTTSGAALVSVLGDVDGAYHVDLNSPPADRHKVSNGATVGTNYDLDYAGLNQNFMVRVHKNQTHHFGAYSKDGGKTWTDFASNPSGINSTIETNYIAVSADAKRIAWSINGQGIYTSSDSGKTWQQATDTNDLSGFRVLSDKVVANVFYVYNPKEGILYKSVNGGTWNSVYSQLAKSSDGDWAYGYFRLFVSPFNEGEIWATQGAQISDVMWLSGDRIGGVQRSTNGGTSFSKVNGIEYAQYIGFGKGKSENPAVYYTGLAKVYRSENYSDWTEINDTQHRYGGISMVVGDPCIYSRVYLGTGGRGIIYGEEAGYENTCPNREDSDYETPTLKIPIAAKSKEGIRLHFDGTGIQVQKILPNGKMKIFNLKGEKHQ